MTGPIAPVADSEPIDPRVRVGHVHLKAADLERSLAFYCGVLGFGLHGLIGNEAAFLAAGSYHHHLAINTWESQGGSPPPEGSTGLHHVAFVYPTRAALGDALRRLRAAAVQLTGASDHGGSEAIYLRDPDGNGVELYWDRPEEEWPRNPDGSLKMVSKPLDVEKLAAEGLSESSIQQG
ncbi:VOC family protein [Bradyrhizobium japonicum]|uniref:VOC family protein n=1 Tax=Bradyrhizobium japonicum TaxID=375 RepID=UPI001BA752A4|nr:VOC family protein [Bradyrhizobium japonicum]MBR0961341.1 VOC family protein [Bradyrhizobium japonicum]